MFKIKLDSKKALEAAVVLARKSPDRKISRKRLLALLYLANRECLKQSGRPIIGGRIAAMKYGPVHTEVYDLIQQKAGAEGVKKWSEHFRNDGYYVVLQDDPAVAALSRFEIELLEEVAEEHQEEDDWDVTWHTHKFPEYQMSYRSGTARTIPLEQVIHLVARNKADSIMKDLKEKEEIDELFANAEKMAQQQ